MADAKVSALTAVGSLGATDEFPVVQSGTSKQVTAGGVLTFFQSRGSPIVASLGADHALAVTTATKVMGVTLAAGTYIFNFYILAQSATLTVSPMFGINFTGTAAVRAFRLRYPGTGTTAISGVADDAGATSGQIEESVAQTAFSTAAPNLGATGGVATINTSILYVIEGLLVVTASGDLELWHGSETATSTTVKAGTSVMVVRTA